MSRSLPTPVLHHVYLSGVKWDGQETSHNPPTTRRATHTPRTRQNHARTRTRHEETTPRGRHSQVSTGQHKAPELDPPVLRTPRTSRDDSAKLGQKPHHRQALTRISQVFAPKPLWLRFVSACDGVCARKNGGYAQATL